MTRILTVLCKAVGIGTISGFIFCLAWSLKVMWEIEHLAAVNDPRTASARCAAGSAVVVLPIFGIITGAILGLVLGGVLLLIHRLFYRRRLP